MIKERLRDLGVTLVEFADALEISRPTLDNYIVLFENGDVIPKDKYQRIFEVLFKKEIDTREKFLGILQNYHSLIERDKSLGTLDFDAKTTDLITSILERMKNDIAEDDYDESIYIFINMLIRSYRKQVIFKQFVNYFLYLNGVKDIDQIEDSEKPFISNAYKLMHLAVKNKLDIDEVFFSKFIERVKDIAAENSKEKESLTERIFKEEFEKKLNLMIQEQLRLGVDIKDIDIKELISKVNF